MEKTEIDDKIIQARKALSRSRIVAVGIWFTLYLLPIRLTALLFIAYIGFTLRFLRKRHPHLPWLKSLGITATFAFTSFLIALVVMSIVIYSFFGDASDPGTALVEFLGLWEGGVKDGGFNYPFFRDFIVPWDWPSSPIRRLN